jgi:tRNA splicing endonuclease
MSDWEEKVALVKRHYQGKGYRVHSGLQFGSELVLYADRPDLVHSDFCIHVVRDGKSDGLFVVNFGSYVGLR